MHFTRGVKAGTAAATPLRKFFSTSEMAKRNDFQVVMKGVTVKTRFFSLLSAASFFVVGCQRDASIPADSFRLTKQDIISGGDVRVSILTIHLSRAASVSVDGEGFHGHIVLPDAKEGVVREGQVALSASRIAPSQDKFAYIQTLIRAQSTNGSYAGGPSMYPVPADTKLETFFSISATSGVYRLDAPITIALLQGKPVKLVVGQPTK